MYFQLNLSAYLIFFYLLLQRSKIFDLLIYQSKNVLTLTTSVN